MGVTLGTQGYVWYQIYTERQGKPMLPHLDDILAQVAGAGLDAWESGIESPEHAELLRGLLAKHGLRMPSMYVGPALHDPATAEEQIALALSKARLGRSLGVSVVVCNPAPLSWRDPLDKDDAQLRHQAAALDRLGRMMKSEGLTLAYHTHATEMRQAAREFHHMLLNTDPAHVSLCLDTHWVYRGSGNSNCALADVLKLYGRRLATLHLRQSAGGVWSETFSAEGDVDHGPVVAALKEMRFDGPLTLEQCFEPGTPDALTPQERHRRSTAAARAMLSI